MAAGNHVAKKPALPNCFTLHATTAVDPVKQNARFCPNSGRYRREETMAR